MIGSGQRKTSPALRHEEASASTGGARSYGRRRLWVGSQWFMDHGYCQVTALLSTRVPAWETRLVRKRVSRVLGVGLLTAAAYAIWRAGERRRAAGGLTWQPRPFPFPPEPRQPPPEPPGTDN